MSILQSNTGITHKCPLCKQEWDCRYLKESCPHSRDYLALCTKCARRLGMWKNDHARYVFNKMLNRGAKAGGIKN